MTIRRKGAAPWSVDYEAGLADAPVSSHPGVEADQVKAVIDAGFIDSDGSWQIEKTTTDRGFTRFGPETLAQNASMFSPTINLVEYSHLILGINSDADHNVEIGFFQPDEAIGPYVGLDDLGGIGVSSPWIAADTESDGSFVNITEDGSEAVKDTWKFWRITNVQGTIARVRIKNCDASSHTIHAAFLRVA